MRRQALEGGLVVYRFETLPEDRVDVLVSTRAGGVSRGPRGSLNLGLHVGDRAEEVIENRRRLFAAAGMPLERSVWCRQVHEDRVAVVSESDIGRGALGERDVVADADAMVTDLIDVPLAVMVADCVPVVIYDPGSHAIGVAHAGWAGTVRRIASATVATMRERWGGDPADMRAVIGPSIGPREYEVGRDVADAARDAYPGDADKVIRTAPYGGLRFDLWAANRIDLVGAGLRPERIETAGISSATALDDFYSHRVEGVTGRFAAVARLRPL